MAGAEGALDVDKQELPSGLTRTGANAVAFSPDRCAKETSLGISETASSCLAAPRLAI